MSRVTCCQWVQVMKTAHYIYQEDAIGVCDLKKKSFREMVGDEKIFSKYDISFMKFFCKEDR